MLIDTHCHLDDPQYEEGAPAVLARAQEAGVAGCVTIGTDLSTSRQAIALALRHGGVFAAAGFHPHEAVNWTGEIGKQLGALAAHPRVVGIGEIGLDYYRNRSPRDIQQDVFRKMLQMALDRNLPVVIHCREAWADTLALIREVLKFPMRGVMHCFSGGPEELKTSLDLGFDVSFAGNITFKNAAALRDVALRVPMDRVVLETDAPYLTPEPHRGKRNEPAFMVHTARLFAQLRGLSAEEVALKTSANAARLFRLPL
ncbi:MAG: TatD family hydrolase [Candidatus Omnitrophica bacterium]|nr:TatD family hydrolase [Candidatus Omnitrophota bacterium]